MTLKVVITPSVFKESSDADESAKHANAPCTLDEAIDQAGPLLEQAAERMMHMV